MDSLSCYLHGPDNLILRADIAVEDLCNLVPAGLDGGADSVNLLQARLVCRRWRYEVLLVWKPPEDCRKVFVVILMYYTFSGCFDHLCSQTLHRQIS